MGGGLARIRMLLGGGKGGQSMCNSLVLAGGGERASSSGAELLGEPDHAHAEKGFLVRFAVACSGLFIFLSHFIFFRHLETTTREIDNEIS